MNLILLLSALLSALGGGTGVRAPMTPTALSSSVASVVKAVATARPNIAARPVQTIGGPASAVVSLLGAFALTETIPAFASRRRE